MSGHSKWATIKRKKAAIDAKRGKVFTKLIKELTVAARMGGGDPDANPRLRTAMDKARAANMPVANIDRAVQKGAGTDESVHYEELTYEGYGPGGVAILMQAMTDNKNRTVGEIRHILSRFGGNLGENGSVAWKFEPRGVLVVEKQDRELDDMLMIVLDAGADDVQEDDENFTIYTQVDDLEGVRQAVLAESIPVVSYDLTMVPKMETPVTGNDAQKLMKLMDLLDDHDDLQNVYTDADFDPDTLDLI